MIVLLAFIGLFITLGLAQRFFIEALKGLLLYKKACFIIYAAFSILLLPLAFIPNGFLGFILLDVAGLFVVGLTAAAWASIKS